MIYKIDNKDIEITFEEGFYVGKYKDITIRSSYKQDVIFEFKKYFKSK